MLKYIVVSMFMGISFVHAENIENLAKLKAEKQALVLKLEAYALKKQIIEMENFIENEKLKKEKKIEREKALIRFKNDLKIDRKKAKHISYPIG